KGGYRRECRGGRSRKPEFHAYLLRGARKCVRARSAKLVRQCRPPPRHAPHHHAATSRHAHCNGTAMLLRVVTSWSCVCVRMTASAMHCDAPASECSAARMQPHHDHGRREGERPHHDDGRREGELRGRVVYFRDRVPARRSRHSFGNAEESPGSVARLPGKAWAYRLAGATESATESTPPTAGAKATDRVRLKWCGKSAPRARQRAWQGKPQPEQGQ